MKNEIEKKLKKEVEQAVPDVYQNILQKASQSGETPIITMQSFKKKSSRAFRAAIGVAAALAIIVVSSCAFLFGQNGSQGCKIEFNVNPCVVLEIDKNERVSSVSAENEDAEIILDKMDLKGTDLDVAVNALMFSMIKHGYIDEMTNSVLVSVSNGGKLNSSEISKHVADDVSKVFEKSSIEGSVMIQSVDYDSQIESIAKQYGISEGKAALIKSIVDSKKTVFSFEALSKLSINEINLLLSGKEAQPDVTVLGSASQKAYIGEKTARQIAFADAQINESQIKHSECSLDLDDGTLVYELEFVVSGAVFEYEIDALTGKVLEKESKPLQNEEQTTTTETVPVSETQSYITKEEIKQNLLSANGLSSGDYKTFEIEFDFEDGKAVYDVEFIAKGIKYEYEIDAVSGGVLSEKTEVLQTQPTTAQSQNKSGTQSSSAYIGTQKATQIALESAGLSESQVSEIEVEFGFNSGIVYKVEFKYSGFEYEYEINARTGAVVDFEKESDD